MVLTVLNINLIVFHLALINYPAYTKTNSGTLKIAYPTSPLFFDLEKCAAETHHTLSQAHGDAETTVAKHLHAMGTIPKKRENGFHAK